MTKSEQKIEINKKMIGKTVYVVNEKGGWYGPVTGVKDEDTFYVKRNADVMEVDIFNIRQVDSKK